MILMSVDLLGAVLTDQRMDLARLQFEIDVPECQHAEKLFFMSVRGQFESPDSSTLPSFCYDLPQRRSFASHHSNSLFIVELRIVLAIFLYFRVGTT